MTHARVHLALCVQLPLSSSVRYATYMNRDTPNYENIAKSVKNEMTDFVSYYRCVAACCGVWVCERWRAAGELVWAVS